MGTKDGGKKPNPNDLNSFKGFFYYMIIIVVMTVLLNGLVFPSALKSQVKEVGYNEFLTMVDNGQVAQVEKDDTNGEIVFITKDSNGKQQIYKTGLWDDPDLTERLYSKGVTFDKVIPQKESAIMAFFTNWILPFLIMIGIGQILSRSMAKRMGGNAMTFGKSNAKIYAESETGVTFADVAGEEEAKDALKEIVDFLHDPKKYSDIGATLPKGALLVGPPGTGKTLLAKAVAGEAHVPFFSISGSEFVEMFVGMGAAKVRDLFKQANEKAPCIVFIDEIDTIGKKRDGSGMGGNDEREQTLNQLLTEMDGFDGRKGVVILAATNRPETLDKALLRPGRFDRRIPVELPDLKGREAILRVHGKDVKMDESVDFNAIARATVGASGAELANIINEGALRAVRMGRRVVSQADLEESVETVIAGYQKKNASVSENERRIVAYHEIGHALVAACQSNSAPVHKITIIPRTSGALGYTMQVEDGERLLMSKEEALNKIATLTGGRAAEEFMFHSITTGASNDIEQATKLARAMVTRYGMSDQFGMVALETVTNQYLGGDTSLACSPETAKAIDDEVIATVKAQYEKAMGILRDHAAKLNELAGYLLEKETITGEEFMEILNR
ncbi:ATP-dependent metallopeptidase FtsH/Yme1/Tma family protein [Clostridium sp. AF12-19]|nr:MULTISPECIES: ATP-dependent zinc metalloprotease FtsH [unclassified Clostridium]RHS23482.1 ATP-dependent metallopeptidase FtsH/Yme1/Tma family protein [Clostridium sp. AF12-28]RHS27196.1 ATP-dependent metallopeptidase FtsH/Yme1/Tma family protein [Clostridium sp. AF12-19]